LSIDLAKLLTEVQVIAEQAGQVILDLLQKSDSLQVQLKADASPVTVMDKAANQYIVEALTQLTPDIPVISEEAIDISLSDAAQADYYWLVDPLDGTKGFIDGSKEYTVNIALIEQYLPVLGVIVAPALGHSFVASTTTAARWIRGGTSFDLSTVKAPRCKRVVLSHYHDMSRLAPYDGLQVDLDGCGQVNSSLKFGLIAAGTYDYYPRLGPTSLWDTAAGQIVLERAGGAVVDFRGQRLQYHLESGLLNPEFLAVGDADIVSDVLEFCAMLRRKQ